MRVLQIATLGDEEDQIYVGIKEYPVSKLVIIHEPTHVFNAAEVARKLRELKIEVEPVQITNPAKDMYEVVSGIVNREGKRYDDILMNVSGGRKLVTCAAISAAYIHGLKAFHVEGNTPMMLPILKFSYGEIVSNSKMEILKALHAIGGRVDSLNALSEKSRIEKSLLSYHLRGGRESKGLEELGLVRIGRATQGRLIIELTDMGRLLVISQPR